MKRNNRRVNATLFAAACVALLLTAAACSSTAPSASSNASAGPTPSPSPSPSISPAPTPTPAPSIGGFVFAADDIIGYYQTLGYTCAAEQPSATAAGFSVRTCSLLDPEGRTREIGVVTDPTHRVANGFASLAGTDSDTFLDPVVALEPLAAFLGAMLGEEGGAALLPWLAAHLGDAYAETTAGPITVATYTDGPNLHSKLYVELGNQEYLTAPGTPTP